MGLFDGEEEKTLDFIQPEVVSLPKKSWKKKPMLKEQFENLPAKQVSVDTLSDEDKSVQYVERRWFRTVQR